MHTQTVELTGALSRQLARLASLAQNLSEFLVVDGGKDHRERVSSKPIASLSHRIPISCAI